MASEQGGQHIAASTAAPAVEEMPPAAAEEEAAAEAAAAEAETENNNKEMEKVAIKMQSSWRGFRRRRSRAMNLFMKFKPVVILQRTFLD